MKDSGKKKLLMIAIGIVVFVIVIMLILLLVHALNSKKTTYKDIENKVLTAAKNYYKDNETLLPKKDSEQVTTNDSALTSAGYLKSMSELTKDMDGATCSAEVVVSNSNGNYRYTVLLDCGEKYSSKSLTSHIKSQPKVVSGDGLYQLNGELVYRGEYPNNHVKFSNRMWRIVKVSNDNVVLIYDEKFASNVWDDRYNIKREYQDGINDFNVSRIKDTLDEIYKESNLFTASTRGLLKRHSVYTGKRGIEDTINDGSIEKSNILENQYIGLLPLYDYINASIDGNCKSANDRSCSNYNYLSYYEYYWWTITADKETTHRVYRISGDGEILTSTAASNGYIRPVVYLASDVQYAGGTGTETDPYIIK